MEMTREAVSLLLEVSGQAASVLHGNIEEALNDRGLTGEPGGARVLDLEQHMPDRRRVRGTYATDHLESFKALVTDMKPDAPVLAKTADTSLSATAILNRDGNAGHKGLGHHDSLIKVALPASPEYVALMSHAIADQRTLAEFIEDYDLEITCLDADGETLPTAKALSAIRKVTVEQVRSKETTESNYAASQSGFEAIEAKSVEVLPHRLLFRCVPFKGLGERVFPVRLGIRTGGEKPQFTLKIVRHQEITDQIGEEFVTLLKTALPSASVQIGEYQQPK